ncbi:ABC transporter permease [Brevibacterium luteolum]|uniref:ABC transporter permease n=1 Tax=Brevibacterium luteolum TaxID=199591 RepID=UPI001C21C0A7|nr:FtsX-like permease family protein [Brevibacterium luteolum]MBU8578696.1 FtsX-like permease family protein [Brevibacterium luteolum]
MNQMMKRDLWFHRITWLWTFTALLVCSTCVGTVFASAASVGSAIARVNSEAMALELQSLVSVLMAFIGITACAVIATNTRLVVLAQSRSHALWKILGMPPRKIRRIVLTQVTVLGAIAGACAAVLAPVASILYVQTWSETGLPVSGPPAYSPSVLFGTIMLTIVFALAGAWRPAKRAARVNELQALRDAAMPTSRMTKSGLFAGACLVGLAGLCFFTGVIDGIYADGEPDAIVAGMLMLLAAALALSAWTLPATLACWSWFVRAQALSWHLARAAVRQRTAQSISGSLPYALAISLIGTLYGSVAAAGVEANGIGMVLGLILPICIAGGMGTVAMCGTQRRNDARMLETLGVARNTINLTNAIEGASYGITGLVFGWFFTLSSSVVGSLLLGMPVIGGLGHLPWGLLALLTICCLAVPTFTAVASGRLKRESQVQNIAYSSV